jgi:hypothetical protein
VVRAASRSALDTQESTIASGRLHEAVRVVSGQTVPTASAPQAARDITVQRPLPRWYGPVDPVILVQGGKRSFKHGADGRFAQDGTLVCRLSGAQVRELTVQSSANIRVAVLANDLLERGVDNGSTPPECDELLGEAVLLDPGSASAAASATAHPNAQSFVVEQTAWWALRDPAIDPAPILAHSGIAGMLPSPIAITPPVAPWTPLVLEWEVEYLPSAQAAADWDLGEIDFAPLADRLPAANAAGKITSGRAILTRGASDSIASAAQRALDQANQTGSATTIDKRVIARFSSTLASELHDAINLIADQLAAAPSDDRAALRDLIGTLADMDVLSGALDGLHTQLRGGYAGDGSTVPTPPAVAPPDLVALRAGFVRLRRLRLVDAFGQALYLAGSGPQTPADPARVVLAEPLVTPGRADLAAFVPRFTSPARLWLRYVDAASDDDANEERNPLCGFVLPNHLDGALEAFDIDGTNLGTLRPDATSGVAWEGAPGTAATVGQQPPATAHASMRGMLAGLRRWGVADAGVAEARETALSALLRVIDSTLWSVDPYGHVGEEHLALLVGHPVALLRARLRIEVDEPIASDTVAHTPVPVRLGALAHWQDGLFGYFVDDDFTTFYCADRAAADLARKVGPMSGFLQSIADVPDYYATFANDIGAAPQGQSPVGHPFIAPGDVVWVRPNREVSLLLLVEPFTTVHATVGLVPRKEIGMRRNWLQASLERLAPTFRFGPLLVDPKTVRMPVANDLHGSWSWDHRADVAAWAHADVVRGTQDALLPVDPPVMQEGWLTLSPRKSGT